MAIYTEWRLLKTKNGKWVAGADAYKLALKPVVFRTDDTDNTASYVEIEDFIKTIEMKLDSLRSAAVFIKDQEIPVVRENMREELERIKRIVDKALNAFDMDVLHPEDITATLDNV
jgi:hypothetical protein